MKDVVAKNLTELRTRAGFTQIELAEKINYTDKAVSKWERDLSFPDVNSIPKLAEIFHVTVDELMQVKADTREAAEDNKLSEMISLIFKGIALAMGIAVVVLSWIDEIEASAAIRMLGIGLSWSSAQSPGLDLEH